MKALMIAPSLNYESFEYHESQVLNRTRLIAFTDDESCRKAYAEALKYILEDEGLESEFWYVKAQVKKPQKPTVAIDASDETIKQLRADWAATLSAYESAVEERKNFQALVDAAEAGDEAAVRAGLELFTLEELVNFIDEIVEKSETVQRCYELTLEGPL